METVTSIGRRKAAIARVFVREGKGNITVNKREFKDYFPIPELQFKVLQPLKIAGVEEQYDFVVNVSGGGFKGQAEALRLGIARALVKINEESKPALKAESMLTRDAREVERKKPGQPKARKRFQFSKR
jgi:small subunit ribosomal protein S9